VLFGASTPFAKILLGLFDPWVMAGLLYIGAGLGLSVEHKGADWTALGTIQTASGARTSLFVPELDRPTATSPHDPAADANAAKQHAASRHNGRRNANRLNDLRNRVKRGGVTARRYPAPLPGMVTSARLDDFLSCLR
jgi:hypothetical protein